MDGGLEIELDLKKKLSKQSMDVRTSQTTVEWYTPRWITDAAREVMGSIDLDPASHPMPQEGWIKAGTWCSPLRTDAPVWQDGLALEWSGNVWLNPPYGKTGNKSNQDIWTRKLALHYERGDAYQGVALINSYLGYPWYEDLTWNRPVCQLRELVRFVNAAGTQGGRAKVGSTVVFFGEDVDGFRNVFSHYGKFVAAQGRRWNKKYYYH